MEILIEQEKTSVRPVYNIRLHGAHFIARARRFFILDEILVSDKHANIVAKINKKASLFKVKYIINIDFKVYRLFTKTFWKPSYSCVGDSTYYEIIEHNKLKYSIFRDKTQIGAFFKSQIVAGAGDKYRILLDNDANYQLIVCMVIALDNARSDEKDEASVTVDFGILAGELKPFDELWRPK